MSGLHSALSIGRTALAAQLYSMQVAGNNIANINTKGYTRQQVELSPSGSVRMGNNILVGTGVSVSEVRRVRDGLLDIHIREQSSSTGGWTALANTLEGLESVYSETGDGTIGDLISDFWDSWQDLSTDPESIVSRTMVKDQALMMVNKFNQMGKTMYDMRQAMNTDLQTMVSQVNSIAERISDLNAKIQGIEGGGQQANDYRDERDLLLDELAEYVNISTAEMQDGTVNVYVSGSILVSSSSFMEMDLAPNAEGFHDVVWDASGNQVNLTDGKMKGLLDSRDIIIPKYKTRLDQIANSMIESVNRVHSRGMSSILHTGLTASNGVSDPTAALDSAGLDYNPVDGTFTISIYDSDGNFVEEQTITVDADTDSLNDIRDAINSAFVGTGNISASINAENKLELTASGTNSFSFLSSTGVGDSSDLLMALGLNTFFTGSDSDSIDVNSVITADPELIATGTTTAPGDGSNALAIGDLRDSKLLNGGTSSISDYYEATIGSLGIDSQESKQMLVNAELLGNTYIGQRQLYSGVSLDEEMSDMIKFQQAYNAAAKFIAAIDETMRILLQAF